MTENRSDAQTEAEKQATKPAVSQPGPVNDNPNEDNNGTGTHGDAPAPSSGNTDGGGPADSSGAPAGTV